MRACVYMHACMYVFMNACVHACMRACVHACMYACVCACMRACVHTCMRACVHAYIPAGMHACMRAFVHMCRRVCMCACVHVSMQACLCARILEQDGATPVANIADGLRAARDTIYMCMRGNSCWWEGCGMRAREPRTRVTTMLQRASGNANHTRECESLFHYDADVLQ